MERLIYLDLFKTLDIFPNLNFGAKMPVEWIVTLFILGKQSH